MTIMGNSDAAVQTAVATLIQALQNIANKNSGDDEEAEVDNDLLTYRKRTTVIEVDVNLQAIAKAGLTLFNGIGEALRANREARPDPLAVAIQRQRKAADANLTGAINAVFGGSAVQGVDPQVLKSTIAEALRKLERVYPGQEVTLDPAGLSDLAAQVVAVIPPAMICDVELPARLHRLVTLIVPSQHHLVVREALLNAAQVRATEQGSKESEPHKASEQPGQA